MENFRIQCYICKNTIWMGDEAEHPLDPCASVLIGHSDKEWVQQKEQTFYCHALCFSKIVADDSLMYIMEPDFCTHGEVEGELMSHKVEAEITFLPFEHGGRRSPIVSGYRPQFYYDGHDWDARYEFPDVDEVQLGQKVRTFIRFLSPDAHQGRIYSGMPFLIREGNRTVGYGSIIQGTGVDIPKENSQPD